FRSTDGTKIIIAFRGTSDQSGSVRVLNGAADYSFGGSMPTDALKSSIVDGAFLIKRLREQNPGASITLTRHSLGGAMAQILGEATGLDAVAFNAPGGGNLYGSLAPSVQAIVGPAGPGTLNNNYRIDGDQVSLFGQSIGTTITLQQPRGVSYRNEP